MATRVSSTRFVGRAEQVAELRSALDDAAAAHPSLAFLAGESGAGKTRLIDELASRAREAGSLVLSGDSVELGEGELPYAPLIAALRPLVRSGHPALAALDPSHRADLATTMPGAGEPAADAPVAQVRVFEALLALLDLLSEDAPVLLVVEDVHWADSSTRGFLSFLARTLCRERLLVVASYRSDELHRRHPLRPLLAEIVRDRYARIVELPLLTPGEMAEQLEDILGESADPALGERLYARSDGNPLFTEELLAAGLDGRGALPPTLRDALMLRVEGLSEQAQRVLRWLSVHPADDGLLAELTELDPGELRDALRETMASHIAVATSDDTFAFRHALLREVVYDNLLPGERVELHAALARALEQRVDSADKHVYLTAQIAHHWHAAGDQPAAFAASVRAAAAAESVNAYGEALALIERALALWDRVDDAERLAGEDQVSVLLRASNLADVAGEAVRQEALLRRALELTDAEGDPRRAARVLERLARAQGFLNRQDESLVTIERALALLPAGESSPERAALLAAGAKARMLQSRFADAAERARAALDAARQLEDGQAIELRALNALGVALAGTGDFDAGAAALRDALARSEHSGLTSERNVTYVNLADLLSLSGHAEDGLKVAREGLEHSPPGTRDADWLALAVAESAYHCGRWEEAEAAIPVSARRGSGTLLTLWRLTRSLLALGRGDVDLAEAELEVVARALRESTEVQFIGGYGWMQAELERRRGALDVARTVVDDTLDRIEFCSEDMPRIALVSAIGVRVEADAAQWARDRRDAEGERRARERGGAMLERVALAASAWGPVEHAELISARAEDARAAGADDPAAWDEAARAWTELGRPYPALYARLRQAEAFVACDDRGAAGKVAGAARDEARELGSEWLVEALESLGAGARLRLGPTTGHKEQPKEHPFGLTEREQQVLALVARGATNREVGIELHMAEKTASVHVSRILAKLDVRSRTEAAALAHRQGLAEGVTFSLYLGAPVELRPSIATLQLAEPFGIARGSRTEQRVVRVEVEADGVVGRGEAAPIYYRGETDETALAFLGAVDPPEDPFDLEAGLPRQGDAAGRSALDAALHDWIGRRLGVPVWRLLGLSRENTPATSYTIGIDTVEGTLDRVRRASEFRALKIKVGGTEDVARLYALRTQSEAPLRVDANEGWSLEQARELMPVLVELGVELVEQPFPAADLESFRALRELAPRPPIIVDEGCHDSSDVAAVAAYADGINIKLAKSGGLREAVRMANTARALGLSVMLGCMIESQLGIAPAAQIASLADWVDLDGHLLLAGQPYSGLAFDQGRVLPSDGPGLGVERTA